MQCQRIVIHILDGVACIIWYLIIQFDILISQFPQVLEELGNMHTRLSELQALFAAADEEEFEDTDDTGVMNADVVKTLKDELKTLNGEWKEHLKKLKQSAESLFLELKVADILPKDAKKTYYCSEGFGAKEVAFENANRILELARNQC